jgi:hypothetical protein
MIIANDDDDNDDDGEGIPWLSYMGFSRELQL